MSTGLIIFKTQKDKFNRDQIIQAISSMSNTYDHGNLENLQYTTYIGKYKFEVEYVNFDISKNLLSITIDSLSKAALHFAISLQQKLDFSLSVTDDNYSFLCILDNISSIEEFNNIISEGIFID